MADDDLNIPLGRAPKRRSRFALPVTLPQVAAGALGLCLAVFAGWALFADDPLGGEPMIVASAGVPTAKPMPPAGSTASAEGARSYDGPAAGAAVPPPAKAPAGAQTVTIIDGSTGKRREVEIPGTFGLPESPPARAPKDAESAPAPAAQRLIEVSAYGPIPKIAPDGTRPADAYARADAGRVNGPRVAILVTGLGISTNATQAAFAKLPSTVTFAFAPYATDVDRLAARARTEGREVVLQIPMEPFDYPENDSGPQTLLSSLPIDQNLDRLHWLMSRFQGYVGVVNYMGARFTASEQALGPMLREISKRGLIYIDDGSSPRSLAGQIASAGNLPFAKAEVVLDALPTSANIDRSLARLEAMARERGVAIGITSALPASIERIAQWSKTLEARGITLTPITAVALKAKSS